MVRKAIFDRFENILRNFLIYGKIQFNLLPNKKKILKEALDGLSKRSLAADLYCSWSFYYKILDVVSFCATKNTVYDYSRVK